MSATDSRWRLFVADECSLCDKAIAILALARAPDFESVWIDDDPALEALYGTRVPVFHDDAEDRDLEWPFDVEDVARFLDRDSSTR